MAEIDAVPMWLVSKQTFSAGVRLPKRRKWYDDPEWKRQLEENRKVFRSESTEIKGKWRPLRGGFNPTSTFLPSRVVSVTKIEDVTNGNLVQTPLGSGDFRYWLGIRPGEYAKANPGLSWCRCCNKAFFNYIQRKAHKGEGCGARIEVTFKRLYRHNECLICHKPTKKKRWGAALCGMECERKWMYEEGQPAAFVTVLNEVIGERQRQTLIEENAKLAEAYIHGTEWE